MVCRKLLLGKTTKFMCFLHPYQIPTVFISSDAIIIESRNTSSHALLGKTTKFMCFLHPYQIPTVFISSDAIIIASRNTGSHALFAQIF